MDAGSDGGGNLPSTDLGYSRTKIDPLAYHVVPIRSSYLHKEKIQPKRAIMGQVDELLKELSFLNPVVPVHHTDNPPSRSGKNVRYYGVIDVVVDWMEIIAGKRPLVDGEDARPRDLADIHAQVSYFMKANPSLAQISKQFQVYKEMLTAAAGMATSLADAKLNPIAYGNGFCGVRILVADLGLFFLHKNNEDTETFGFQLIKRYLLHYGVKEDSLRFVNGAVYQVNCGIPSDLKANPITGLFPLSLLRHKDQEDCPLSSLRDQQTYSAKEMEATLSSDITTFWTHFVFSLPAEVQVSVVPRTDKNYVDEFDADGRDILSCSPINWGQFLIRHKSKEIKVYDETGKMGFFWDAKSALWVNFKDLVSCGGLFVAPFFQKCIRELRSTHEEATKQLGTHSVFSSTMKKAENLAGNPQHINTILKSARLHFHDPAFFKSMDKTAHLFPIKGKSVIDLRTGKVHQRLPEHMFSIEGIFISLPIYLFRYTYRYLFI